MHILRHSPLYIHCHCTCYCTAALQAQQCTAAATCYSEAALAHNLIYHCICHCNAALQVFHNRCICHCNAALQASHSTSTASVTATQLCKYFTPPLLHLPMQSSSASISSYRYCICHCKAALRAFFTNRHCTCCNKLALQTLHHSSFNTTATDNAKHLYEPHSTFTNVLISTFHVSNDKHAQSTRTFTFITESRTTLILNSSKRTHTNNKPSHCNHTKQWHRTHAVRAPLQSHNEILICMCLSN